MRTTISDYCRAGILLMAALALLPAGAAHAAPYDKEIKDIPPDDWQLTGTFGYGHFSGNYGTPRDTSVDLGLSTLSLGLDNFRFTASMPYMHIDGRGLVMFDASGNPIVINRRATLPADSRTGWGDLSFSASYTIPPAILKDFEVRISGVAKIPTASGRRRLSTGETDLGMSVDISRQFGDWGPFVTVGYLSVGQPVGYTLYDTTSVSAGTSLELSDHLVAIASYDYDSADGPLVPAAQGLSGSLSWVRDDHVTLTGYGTVGLSDGSPDMGLGILISYGFR
jgi:opacity protein-like surface antigen